MQGQIRYLKHDITDDSESRFYAFEFANLIADGDSLLSSPTPTVEQSSSAGATALTLSSIAVSGTQVEVRITGGTIGVLYSMSCLVTTALGDTLVSSGGLQIIGSA